MLSNDHVTLTPISSSAHVYHAHPSRTKSSASFRKIIDHKIRKLLSDYWHWQYASWRLELY